MKKGLSILFLLFSSFLLKAQDTKRLLDEGIKLHDEGKFAEAIGKYDSIISIDPNNYLAYYEKSYSLLETGEYEKSMELSKFILKKFPEGNDNASVYVNYGTCYDLLKKPEKALEIYNEGLRKYPESSLLHFNKAITLYNTDKKEDAMAEIEKSIHYNPYHASSHNIMAALTKQNRIYSLLASLYFLAIEPVGKRANARILAVESLIGANVEKKDDKTINISLLAPDKNKEVKPNDFQSIELILSLSAALNLSNELKDETRISRMKRNLESVFSGLSETEKGKGLGWEFYAPFFRDLKKQNHLDTFCHIIYASVDDNDNDTWLEENESKVEEFMDWFREYWKTS